MNGAEFGGPRGSLCSVTNNKGPASHPFWTLMESVHVELEEVGGRVLGWGPLSTGTSMGNKAMSSLLCPGRPSQLSHGCGSIYT